MSRLAVARIWLRGRSSLLNWPEARGWVEAAAIGAATLLLIGAIGFGLGLYTLRSANLVGMPWRLLTDLVVPAFGEEFVFRGLMIPGREETRHPGVAICIGTLTFISWHVFEAFEVLPSAKALFLKSEFLACAATLGLGCAWMRWRSGSIWPGVALHWLMVTIWQTWLGGFTL